MHEYDRDQSRRKHRTSVAGVISIRAYNRKYYQQNAARILRRKRERERQENFVLQFDETLRPIVRELVAGPMLKREISERFGVSLDTVRYLAEVVNVWGNGGDAAVGGRIGQANLMVSVRRLTNPAA